jgi:hypothetical protein
MKRYFDLEDFITFLNLLEENKPTSLFVESVTYEEEVEGEIEECKFQKINFCGEDVILYDTLRGSIGLIQDTPVAPWDDYAEAVYEDLVQEGEYKLFIKSK